MNNQRKQTCDKLIEKISTYGKEHLLYFLDEYNITGLKDATAEQLAEYIEKNLSLFSTNVRRLI